MGNSIESLSVDDRVQQYREMADATLLKAQKAEDPLVRTRYLNLATQWHALAQQLEVGHSDADSLESTHQAPPLDEGADVPPQVD